MRDWAYIIGVVVGSIAVLTACVVWYNKQIFGTGGAILCIVGMVLIGMSVWGSVRIKLTGGIEAKLEKQAERIKAMAGAALVISNEVTKLAGISDTNSMRSAEFEKVFAESASKGALPQSTFKRIQELEPPILTVDLAKLEQATKSLTAIREEQ